MTLITRNLLVIFYLAALFILAIFYYPILDFYFIQDDFFHINISQADNLESYLRFFKFRDDIIGYRPISLQNYFFFAARVFNLNPVGFRLITLITIFASSLIITKIVTKITKNANTGLVAAIFWLTASSHFYAITWISAAYNVIGTFFFLITSLTFLKYLESKKRRYYLLSLLFFLITTGSFEFSPAWPIIFFIHLVLTKTPLTKCIKIIMPYFIIAAIYITGRIFFIKVPQIPEYQISLNLSSIKTFIWYFIWALNVPEEFKKQIAHSLFVFNDTFLWQFWQLIFKTTTQTLWIIFTTILIPIYFILRNKNKLSFLIIIFFASWFIIAISPVLLLPNHTFIMYLTLSSIGIYSLIAYILVSSKKTYLLILSVAIWILSSLTTINFYKVNFWMIEAQKVAKESNSNIKRAFPHVKNNSAILYYLPYSWQIQALANMEFIKAIYNDPSLSIYYNKESLTHDFRQGKITGQVYIYINQ